MKLLACLSYYKQRGAALARHLLPTHCVPLPTSEPSSWDWGKLRSRAAEFISLSVFPRTKQLCREATVAWVGDGAEETEEVAGGRWQGRERGWWPRYPRHKHPPPARRK